MSSLIKSKKLAQPISIETQRVQVQLDHKKYAKAEVEKELIQYFQQFNLECQKHPESFYPEIYNFIKHKAPNLEWKKIAHELFREHIQKINSNIDEPLALPSLTLNIQREQSVLSLEWMKHGHQIDKIIDKIWDYWRCAKDSEAFTDEEIIGNILITAILYSGLNHKASLEALLEYLKDPSRIRNIDDMNIIFLEPLSRSYGDLFHDDKKTRKSRNFIPDQITRLWLIHFNVRQIRTVDQSLESYVRLIFNKIQQPFNSRIFKQLCDYANFNWMQLAEADIEPALSQCLTEKIETCGLSESEFERFIQSKFQYQQELMIDYSISSNLSPLNHLDPKDIPSDLDNVIQIHQDLLKLIHSTQPQQKIEILIIQYCIENSDKFNEYTKRIVLWLISLYKPSAELIQKLAEYFEFNLNEFQKICQQYKAGVNSSICIYFNRIAEPWLIHSLHYSDSKEDLDTNLSKIYQQIITNIRLAEEAYHPELKISESVIIRMLKRFHAFQHKIFHASSFDLEIVALYNRPKAQIIGPNTYQRFIDIY